MIDHYDGDLDRLVDDHPVVELHHCRLALSYRREHPDEIADAIAQNRRTPEEWLALYPFIEFVGEQGSR